MDLDRIFKKLPPGKEIRFDKKKHPRILEGFEPTLLGEPKAGLPAQLRKGNFHAHDYGEYCDVHRDRWNPETHPVEHLIDDAPHILIGSLLCGAVLGTMAWKGLKSFFGIDGS
jgi:hypothetical protein